MTDKQHTYKHSTDDKPGTHSINDTLVAIKAELRATMNGVASKAYRQSGTAYRLVYGVELPRLRTIAADFEPDRRLAMALWNDNIRETRMLAVMLFPEADFDCDIADLWAENLRRDEAELAGLLVMDRIATAPFAADKAFQWMADERETLQLCGFLTITRLLMQEAQLSPAAEAEFLDQAVASLVTDYLPLRKAVTNALLRYGESSPTAQHKADNILTCI